MNWFDCLQTFEIIAEKQSFVGAARTLNVPNSVVTKRIQWLENELKITLLVRTTRKVTLSDAGEHLLKKIKPLLAEWRDIHLQLIDYRSQPQGEIILGMAPGLIRLPMFIDTIKQFNNQYPYIQLNIKTIHNPLKMIDANMDALIATDKYILDPGTTVGHTLLAFEYKCYASSTFIDQHGSPRKPDDLKKYNCLIYGNDTLWEYDGKSIAVDGNLHVDSGEALIASCVSGLGLIYIPDFIAKGVAKQKKLRPILDAYLGKKDNLMLFYPKHEYTPSKIILLTKLLRDSLKNGGLY